jgi:hypothetical protein
MNFVLNFSVGRLLQQVQQFHEFKSPLINIERLFYDKAQSVLCILP